MSTLPSSESGSRFCLEARADDDDWIGLEHDLILRGDQLDSERHVEWPIAAYTVHLYYEPGGSAVSFQIEADHDFELRADTLVYPLQQVVIRADR